MCCFFKYLSDLCLYFASIYKIKFQCYEFTNFNRSMCISNIFLYIQNTGIVASAQNTAIYIKENRWWNFFVYYNFYVKILLCILIYINIYAYSKTSLNYLTCHPLSKGVDVTITAWISLTLVYCKDRQCSLNWILLTQRYSCH